MLPSGLVAIESHDSKDRFQSRSRDAGMHCEGISVEGPQGNLIQSTQEMILRFTSQVGVDAERWAKQLINCPAELESIERNVHQAYAQGADLLVAGLIAMTIHDGKVLEAAEQTRRQYSRPLQKGRQRATRVRLLGGMIVWAFTLYAAPKKKLFGKDNAPRVGLDITLAQFGFGKAISPGLQSRVARQMALCPSIAFAQKELARQGVEMDAKAIKRITYQCGDGLLSRRRHQIKLLREKKLVAGKELAGKHVSVQIDGGRMKIRGKMKVKQAEKEPVDEDGLLTGDAPGRSKKKPKRSYAADWREPKLMTIFVHDEHGKMVKETKATMDATLLGPDAIAEIVAMHLHRLGAAEALSVTFVADGAPWIWDRIERIVELAGLEDVVTYQVLDCCHAVHHVSKALASLGLNREERNPLYRDLRSRLRNGQWQQVVDVLSDLQNSKNPIAELETEIAYLRRHGEAGRLMYVRFRQLGIPCGSGAIESGIRRILNLRLKSNAMFWKMDHAESILQVRCQVVPDQWDAAMSGLLEFRRQEAYDSWTWEPGNMSVKNETPPALAT